MTSLLTLSLVILYTTLSTEACDPPQDWRLLEPKDVLGNMDLVILGSFLSQENKTETIDGRTRYILAVNTEVDCILKNINGVNVDRNIKITEIRDNINTCKDDFSDIRVKTHVAIGIKAHSDETRPSEWAFDEYKLQGPYFYWHGDNMVDVDKLTWVCGFQSSVAPTGGDCPAVTLPQDVVCQEPETAGVGRPMVNVALVFVVVSLLSLL